MHRFFVFALLFGTVLSIAMSGEARAAYGPDSLPFVMSSYEVVVSEGPTAECPFVQVFIEGTGTATHMGVVTVYRNHCFTPFASTPISNGYWEAHGADGSMIWGYYSGALVPTEFDELGNPVAGIITSPYTVEGGTNRFANATGQGTAVGDYDLVANAGDFVSSGTINR